MDEAIAGKQANKNHPRVEERGRQGVEAAPQQLHKVRVPPNALQDQEGYQQQWVPRHPSTERD